MTEERVRLSLPAAPEYARFARVTAASLAARLGFSYDEVEDLRLAVDEACHALIASQRPAGPGAEPGPSGTATLELHYATTPAAIEVEGCLQGNAGEGDGLSDLGRRILGALVDEYRCWSASGGGPTIWLRKARPSRDST